MWAPGAYSSSGWPYSSGTGRSSARCSRMTAEKLQRVIAEHLAEDRPVPELYGQPDET